MEELEKKEQMGEVESFERRVVVQNSVKQGMSFGQEETRWEARCSKQVLEEAEQKKVLQEGLVDNWVAVVSHYCYGGLGALLGDQQYLKVGVTPGLREQSSKEDQ